MIKIALLISLAVHGVALLLAARRAFAGPTVADRVVAVDAAAAIVMGLILVGSIWLRETKYLDYVLILAVVSFVGTAGYARYLERGVLIERDHH